MMGGMKVANNDNSKQQAIEDFKKFIKKHPKLIEEVRNKQKSWQELFEDWYLLGEDDQMWRKYKDQNVGRQSNNKKKNNSEFMGQLFSLLKNADLNELQGHITNLSSAISNVQQVLEQFQTRPNHPSFPPQQRGPFSHRKD